MRYISLAFAASLLTTAFAALPARCEEAPAPAARAVQELLEWVVDPSHWPGEVIALEVTALAATREGFLLEGAASSGAVFSTLLRVLEDDERFSDVAMGSMTRKSWGVVFEIRFGFTPMPEGPARPTALQEIRLAAWQADVRLNASSFAEGPASLPARVRLRGVASGDASLARLQARVAERLPGSKWYEEALDHSNWAIWFVAVVSLPESTP